ncbi:MULTISPECIES: hypothetical protein [unclassified Streptomyces]|uniref:hypothetical protein n=1 Tax=unclassified Streptomyces TaxID=2593676 RepID=UPI00380A49D5
MHKKKSVRGRLTMLAALLGITAGAVTVYSASAGTPSPSAGTCGANSELLFCEDFESLAAGPAQSSAWETDLRAGSLTVTEPGADESADGRFVRVRTDGNGKAFIKVNGLEPPANSFFGRIRMRVETFPTAPDFAHWIMVEAQGKGDGLIRPLGGQFFGEKNANFYGVGSDLGPTGDWTEFKESAPATDAAWQCLEWQMDASDNRITVWIDGEEKPDLTVDTRNHGGADVDFVFPEFNTVSFGWQVFQDNPTPAVFNADLDDLALSATRIGC